MLFLLIMFAWITVMRGMDNSIDEIVHASDSLALIEAESALFDDWSSTSSNRGSVCQEVGKSSLLASTINGSAIDRIISDIKPAVYSALEWTHSRSGNQYIDFASILNAMMLVRFEPGQRAGNILMGTKLSFIEGNARSLFIRCNYNLETKTIELDLSMDVCLKIEQDEKSL